MRIEEHPLTHSSMSSKPPIFVLGVPRSGTTLLRLMLDSHPAIACGPETPWLCGHQARSIMALCDLLADEPQGYCASFNMPRDVVTGAARDLVSRLMEEYARARGKSRWAEKTPDNALHVDFLATLFPEAKFIHLARDGVDTSASTSLIAKHRKGISTWHENKLSFGEGAITNNNPFTAMLRWSHWTRLIERSLRGREHLRISYERLITETEPTLRQICDFIGEPFDPAMMRFGDARHDLPAWEWGTADVQLRPTVTSDSIGRGRRAFTPTQLEILSPLVGSPSHSTPPLTAAAAIGSVADLREERFLVLMRWFNHFAQPLGLRTFIRWSKVWEYPWLWFNAISRLRHDGLRVVDLGSELSPMPWILALLGARVTIVEATEALIPHWEKLREHLRVDIDWLITDSERIPLADGQVDLITSLSVLEHQPDKAAAMAEISRVLRPGGALALSFDICEPQMGMTYPEWGGRPMTLGQFEKQIWLHEAFGNRERPEWNRADMRQFLNWHRKSAEHHNYVAGAAVMIRR